MFMYCVYYVSSVVIFWQPETINEEFLFQKGKIPSLCCASWRIWQWSQTASYPCHTDLVTFYEDDIFRFLHRSLNTLYLAPKHVNRSYCRVYDDISPLKNDTKEPALGWSDQRTRDKEMSKTSYTWPQATKEPHGYLRPHRLTYTVSLIKNHYYRKDGSG